ncbi:MAG: ATPase [Betaproteobacteria bacterium]|nr:ATPase [Betaproteobacteria bacterium]
MLEIPSIDLSLQQNIATLARRMEQVLFEVKRVIVGQDRLLERVLIALLARGHLLVEGMPGLAKTLTINTLAQVLQVHFKRIQFTPDLMPADLIGSRVFHPRDAAFQTLLGPVFANLLLADEINRAPPKVQSALLEAMQEGQVTIAGQSHQLPKPFVVMATQNPIETEGQVYVDPSLIRYAVSLSAATRKPSAFGLAQLSPLLMHGASPRASIWMIEAARALAALRARAYVLPEDVSAVALDVLRHRISLSDEALATQIEAETILNQLLSNIPAPTKPLGL